MEKGIKYYREIEKIPSLQNSQETENFTSIFNQCFDDLSRKFPAEGIKKNSNDFKVLLIYISSRQPVVRGPLVVRGKI